MDKLKLDPKLKITSASSRTMLIMQKVSNLLKTVASPSTVQNDEHTGNFVQNCEDSLIFHIPEVTDGIFSNGKHTTKNESTRATDDNATLINNYDLNDDDIFKVGDSLGLINCGLEYLFPVISDGNNAFFYLVK